MVTRTVLIGAIMIFCWAPSAPAAERPTLHPYAFGVCLAALEEVSGVPSWQLVSLRPDLASRCANAPYQTIVDLKGVGNTLTPVQELRATSGAKESPSPRR